MKYKATRSGTTQSGLKSGNPIVLDQGIEYTFTGIGSITPCYTVPSNGPRPQAKDIYCMQGGETNPKQHITKDALDDLIQKGWLELV